MTLGPQFEQLQMFDQNEGTGLAGDPTNAPVRQGYIDTMTGGKSTRASRALFHSQVPLQHLHDVATDGVELHTHLGTMDFYEPASPATSGTPRGWHSPGKMMVSDPSPVTVVHEFGHALHDVTTARWMPDENWQEAGYVLQESQPTKEGVATGYATRYSGEQDTSYDWLSDGYISNQGERVGPFDPGFFRGAQNRVIETGAVPHTSKDEMSDMPGTRENRQRSAYLGWMESRLHNRPGTQKESLF